MTSEVLNGAVEGLITAIFFGGIFVAILGVMARYRRRRGKPSPMKPVWLRVGIGAIFCVLLQANGISDVWTGYACHRCVGWILVLEKDVIRLRFAE